MTGEKQYDVIVIGGGHNGLTTAALLAKEGKKVLVLEKRKILGGRAAIEEFHPGFKTNGLLHDTSQIRPWIVDKLNLKKYGLIIKPGQSETFLKCRAAPGIRISADEQATAESIAGISPKDAASYLEYRAFIQKIKPFIRGLLNEIPPESMKINPARLWALFRKSIAFRRMGKTTMFELMKIAPMSVRDFLDEYFETGFLKAGLSIPALRGSVVGPYASYSTFNLLLHDSANAGHVQGGPGALISALNQSAVTQGVNIIEEACVDRIVLNDLGHVSGVRLRDGSEFRTKIVASACCPKITLLNLINPRLLEYPLEQAITNYRARGVTAKMHLACRGEIHWTSQEERNIEFIRIVEDFEKLERAADAIKYGRYGQDPVMEIYIPTVSNPGLAPENHHVISILLHFIPYHLKEGWTETGKKELEKLVVNKLEKYWPVIGDQILKSELLSPVDLEEKYSLATGHIYHGELAIDQILTRPIPSCAAFKTPVPGLFFCGSGSFPGGGFSCAPAGLASRVISNNFSNFT